MIRAPQLETGGERLSTAGRERAHLRDTGQLLAILRPLASEGARVRFREVGESAEASRAGRLVACSEESLSLSTEEDSDLRAGRVIVRLEGPHFAYDFVTEVFSADGRSVQLAFPESLWRTSGRHARRLQAFEGLVLSFVHPEQPRLWVHRPVRDLSTGGLSFATDAFREGVAVGTRLSGVEVTWDGGSVHLELVVRHVTRAPDGEERCGVRIEEVAGLEAGRWRRFVTGWLHPHTRSGKTWADASWSLYDRSGYFRLSSKAPANFSHLRRAFAVTSRRLDFAPELGSQITWPSARGIEASLSLLRVYAGTSLIYQVARRKDESSPASGRTMLREINSHAFERLGSDPSQEWVLVFVQDDGARWSRLAYREFARDLPPSDDACVLHFDTLELRSARRPVQRAGALRVRPASSSEQSQLLERIRHDYPAAYAEALDLTEDRLELSELRAMWSAHGFRRRREILVAANGQPAAAAVLETAEEGLHLFGLLDSLRLYALIPGGEGAFDALLEAARAWFHRQGKERFVLFAEHDGSRWKGRRGIQDLGGASLIAFSRRLLPEFLEHLHLITSRAGGRHA